MYPASENGIQNVQLELPRGSFTVITGRIERQIDPAQADSRLAAA